jgi:cobalt-zinc-cadmium resistance protein CzcA
MTRFLRGLWANRYSVLLLAALVLAAGVSVFKALPETVFPDVIFPKVAVLVTDSELPAKLMLLEVTRPLELMAQGEPGVRVVRSQTGNGLSKLHVYFSSATNPETAYLLLQARLANAHLPPGAKMSVLLQTPEVYPFAEYALVSNRVDSVTMQPLLAYQIRPALLTVPGVYKVSGTGRGWPEVQVRLSYRRLAAHGLTAAQVVSALRAAQGPFFSGALIARHQQIIVATDPRPANPAALARLTLPLGPVGRNGVRLPLALGALGTVRVGPPPLLVDAAVAHWRHALVIDIQPQVGVDQVVLGQQVHARIAALRSRLPPDVKLVRIYDLGGLISTSLHDVWVALILGSVIAWVVVLIFLRRVGAALATLVVVPLSIAATLIVLHLLGLGLNVMTLGGLTAAIGALVDHAIVVMERGMHARGSDVMARRRSAIAEAARILPAMTLATLTSCLVFVPLISLTGTIGLLFRQMAIAIVVALVASQVVAVVVTPVLAMWLAGRGGATGVTGWDVRLRHWYLRHLVHGMRRPWSAAVAVVFLAGLGILGLALLPTAFLPPWDEGVVSVPYRTPVGSSVAETTRVGRTLMRIALADPAVKRASLVVGRSFAYRRSTPNKGALALVLKRHRTVSTQAVMRRLHRAFRAADPALAALSEAQVMVNRLGDLSGSHAPLEVFLFGTDSAALSHAGGRLALALRRTKRFESITFKSASTGSEITVRPRAVARLDGLTAPALAQAVKTRLWGERAGFLLNGEQILPIRVRTGLDAPTLGGIADLPVHLPASGAASEYAPLGHLAHIGLRRSVPYVTHQALVPYAYIWLKPVPGEGLSAAAAIARAVIAKAKLPNGVTSVLGGYYGQQTRSFKQMALVLGGTLLILLVLFGFQFGGQRMALPAMVSIGLAAPGALAALLVARLSLDSTAFLGILIVYAIAVNNVILIFAVRAHPGAQHGPAQIARAAGSRLRPILMTMLADIGGFLPLAIGVGRGTALLQPLAVAVIGGLALAVLSSLWLAPLIYAVLMRIRIRYSPAADNP